MFSHIVQFQCLPLFQGYPPLGIILALAISLPLSHPAFNHLSLHLTTTLQLPHVLFIPAYPHHPSCLIPAQRLCRYYVGYTTSLLGSSYLLTYAVRCINL